MVEVADDQPAALHLRPVDDQRRNGFGSVQHLGLCCAASPGDLTGVAHLTAGLSVEGCSIENQLDGLARVGLRSFHATRADDCLQRAFTVVSLALVSEKLGLAYLLGEALVYVLDRSFAGAAELRLLAL